VALVIAVYGVLPFMQTPVGWAMREGSRHVAVDGAVFIARAFLIPSFFWISGFLARGTLERGGLSRLAGQRLRRVGLPFAVLLLPTSWALTALWAAGRARQGRPLVAAGVPDLSGHDFTIAVGHLWYLYDLLLVSGGAVLAVAVVRALGGRRSGRRALGGGRAASPLLAWAPLVAAAPLAVLLRAAGKLQLDTPISLAVEPIVLLYHAIFFAWGWLAGGARGNDVLAALSRRAWRHTAGAAVAFVALLPALRRSVAPSFTGTAPALAFVASAALAALATAAFLGLCLRLRPGFRLRFVADASYWSYLVHLPVLVALQIALAPRPWPAPLKLAVVFGGTVAVCLASYRALVRRTPLARFVG